MNLTEYREQHEMTQAEFAEAMTQAGYPTTQALVSHWERGKVTIPAKRAIQIEEVTDGAVSRVTLRPDLWAIRKVKGRRNG